MDNDKWFMIAKNGKETIEKTFDDYDKLLEYLHNFMLDGYDVECCREDQKHLIFKRSE